MKSYAIVTVLTAVMVVSTVAAQDTLRIQSLRSVDLCSGTKRWLIAVSVGTVRFSDSLESFDITIGFDKSILRPTDVLKEGTLSSQMSNGPIMNTTVPGELRIFGFNVARSVAGNSPLVAVAGDYLGTCSEEGVLTLPYAPDFNSEFKKKYSVNTMDRIQTVVNPRVVPSLGCIFEKKNDTATVDVFRKSVLLTVNRTGNGDDMRGAIDVRLEGDTDQVSLYGAVCDNCSITEIFWANRTMRTDYYEVTDPRTTSEAIIWRPILERRDNSIRSTVRLIATVRNRDSCSCIVPGRRDTVEVVFEKAVVGVKESHDDGSCTIQVNDDLIVGKCLHHETKALELYDLYGRRVLAPTTNESQWASLSTTQLSHGVYFATMTCGGGWKQKTIVK